MRAICALLWAPAAGNCSGLPAIHQVASSLRVSSTPWMSFALKRAKNSLATCLFASMLIDKPPGCLIRLACACCQARPAGLRAGLAQLLDLVISKALQGVIVDQSHGLHKGIADG